MNVIIIFELNNRDHNRIPNGHVITVYVITVYVIIACEVITVVRKNREQRNNREQSNNRVCALAFKLIGSLACLNAMTVPWSRNNRTNVITVSM